MQDMSKNGSDIESFIKRDGIRYAKTFNIDVITRILTVLCETNRTKMTNLAGKAGLNYSNCVRYINLLKLLRWADVMHDKNNYVFLTEQGREMKEILSKK